MNIDVEECILNDIGHTDWHGETNYDNESLKNLDKIDYYLYVLEEFREKLILKLENHIRYRKGNGTAEALHWKAKDIMGRHLLKEFTETNFDQYWEEDDE